MLARNVTTIIGNLNPRVKEYLDSLLENVSMQVKYVHQGSAYEPLVDKTKAWTCIGVFYDYLIRKEIYNLLGQEAIDHRASIYEEQVCSYNELLGDILSGNVTGDTGPESEAEAKELISSEFPDINLLQKPVTSYFKYKDPKNATWDIIEDVFNTSMLHIYFFGGTIKPFDPELLNMNNIKMVLEYVGTFNPNNILLNPIVGCKYFRGDADLILDDILVDIKVSKYPLKYGYAKCKRDFYQLLFYALGVFVNENKEIRKFKIYNPLLGIEYYLEIPDLNFSEFSKIVDEVVPL